MISRLLGLALLAAPAAAFAQNVLVVEEGKSDQVVRAVTFNQPMIEVGGKLQAATGTRFALRKAAAYRRGFVKIPDFNVTIRHTDNLGVSYNFSVDVIGHVESSVPLKRCFIVLEITSGKDRGLIYNELPDLAPGESRELRLSARMQEQLESSRYVIHVFSDGLELLNSKMNPLYVLQESKKTDELWLKKAADRPVSLDADRARVVPVYPAALIAQGLVGSARIQCTVNARGEVAAAAVVDATDPLFGQAALEAVRQWTFEPAIVDHHYVEAKVVVPVDFKPPAASQSAEGRR